MPTYTLRNKKTEEIWQVICSYDEMKQKLNDNVKLVPVFPKIVSGVGSLLGRTDDTWKEKLGQIKKTSGRGNTIKL